MSVKSVIEENEQEVIKNDLEEKIDQDKLASLKMKIKESKMPPKIISKKQRSLAFGIIGSGQAGGNVASQFYKLGYDAIALNTANQDLALLDLPESNKLLLKYGLGGAAKELEIGRLAAENYRDEILNMIDDKLANAEAFILCLSLGGGSGAGSCETLVSILTSIGKPVIVISVLPMDTEDAHTKSNSLETLSKLAKFAQQKIIHNLIVIDNAKIESIYHDVGQMEFYPMANKAIVDTLDVFNTLSSMPSSFKPLDSAEFGKILTDGEGLSTYGELSISSLEEETSIAEAIVENLKSNLLAGGFDLKQAKYVGIMITANERTWKKIKNEYITYAMHMVTEICGTPQGTFKGLYTVDSQEDVVKVYSFFSGLGLPESRVEQLKKETQQHSQTLKEKSEKRNLNLQLDTGKDDSVSAAQKVKDKIAQKNSAFGKLFGNSVVDRRK